MNWKVGLILFAGGLFAASAIAYVIVKIALRPKDSDLDDYYEFEENNPQLARYEKWSRITFTAAVVAMLLLFLSTVL